MSEKTKTEALYKESFLLNQKVRVEPVANGSAFRDLLVEKDKAKNHFSIIHKCSAFVIDLILLLERENK
jgi:hypothetical protein